MRGAGNQATSQVLGPSFMGVSEWEGCLSANLPGDPTALCCLCTEVDVEVLVLGLLRHVGSDVTLDVTLDATKH